MLKAPTLLQKPSVSEIWKTEVSKLNWKDMLSNSVTTCCLLYFFSQMPKFVEIYMMQLAPDKKESMYTYNDI